MSWTYGYDDLDRLISASKSGATLGYTYDANGNRLTETGSSPSTFTIAANSNRLSATSGALSRTYDYDAVGNTTSFTGVSFTYNNRGRMSSSTNNGVTTSYVYNALEQLIKKGGDTLYYYDEAGHIVGIYDGSGALKEEIVWLGDTPVAALRPQGGGVHVYNIHTDHLNTPRVITDWPLPSCVGGGMVSRSVTERRMTIPRERARLGSICGSRGRSRWRRRGCITTTIEITTRRREGTCRVIRSGWMVDSIPMRMSLTNPSR